MATKVSEMTTTELKEMIEMIIEQKLIELLGDPDEGRENDRDSCDWTSSRDLSRAIR
jgi:hypothetical protein